MSRRAFTQAPEFAIGLAVVGAFLLVGQDSTIKGLSSSLGIVQILFLRNLIAMGLLWSAVLLGFCGVLVLTRPGVALEWPMLYVLGASLSWAFIALLTRKLGTTESTGTMVFYALASFVVMMAVPIYWIWETPSPTDLALVSLAALVGVSGQMCLIRAYALAEPSVVGPIEYTGLIWATLMGYLIWGHIPDAVTITGALIIAASGLYIIQREAGGARLNVRR